jgi:beta-lactamase regulating signal transducer with metallopeptidase domain
MNNLDVSLVNRIADGWATIMWTVSLQFCLLGLVVLVLHWSLNRGSPNWRYWLWQILAIKLLLMPFWTATTSWTFVDRPVARTEIATLDSTEHHSVQSSVDALPELVDVIPSNGPATDGRGVKPDQIPVAESTKVSHHRAAPERDIAKSVNDDSVPSSPNRIASVQASREVAAQKTVSPPFESSARVTDTVTAGRLMRNQASQQAETPMPSTAIVNSPTNAQDQFPDFPADSTTIPPAGLSWQVWLMLLWMLLVVWNCARILWQGMALDRLLNASEPAGETLVQLVRQAALRLGMTQTPAVRILDLSVSPFVCGLWKVRLVLPRELPESFSPEQLNLVLLHELAHVRRRDLIWGWIPEIGKILFFFHPLAHFVCHQIRFERELACDHLAMTASERDALTYAKTLVRVVEQFSSAIPSNQSPVANSHA